MDGLPMTNRDSVVSVKVMEVDRMKKVTRHLGLMDSHNPKATFDVVSAPEHSVNERLALETGLANHKTR